MAQHTPGPWMVVPSDKAEHRWVVGDADGSSIASCEPVGPWMSAEEADANARLTSAAPDLLIQLLGLLAATRLVISAVGIDPDATNVDFRANGQPIANVLLATLLANADAAVAKAEGR